MGRQNQVGWSLHLVQFDRILVSPGRIIRARSLLMEREGYIRRKSDDDEQAIA
jgi:hypothetical protein